jgi:hypothetical protein
MQVTQPFAALLFLLFLPTILAQDGASNLRFYPLFFQPGAEITKVLPPLTFILFFLLCSKLTWLTITVFQHGVDPNLFARRCNTQRPCAKFLARPGNSKLWLYLPECYLEPEWPWCPWRMEFVAYLVLQVCSKLLSLHLYTEGRLFGIYDMKNEG